MKGEMTLDGLIDLLEDIKSVHGGELPVLTGTEGIDGGYQFGAVAPVIENDPMDNQEPIEALRRLVLIL
jgi:hypothetical protein